MTNSQRLATVRRCLTNWLAQNATPQHPIGQYQAGQDAERSVAHGTSLLASLETEGPVTEGPVTEGPVTEGPVVLPGPGRPPFQESILICDGFYCGRRLDAGDYTAVWFLEEDELKISDAFGDLKCVLRGSEIAALAEESPAEAERGFPARRAA